MWLKAKFFSLEEGIYKYRTEKDKKELHRNNLDVRHQCEFISKICICV